MKITTQGRRDEAERLGRGEVASRSGVKKEGVKEVGGRRGN